MAVDLSDPRITDVYYEMTMPTGEARVLSQLLEDGDSFIDIGANHGSYSLLARKRVGERGRVVAFEPQPHLARLLSDHLG